MEAEIQRLNHAFPLGDGRTSLESSLSLREYIRCQLPSRQESAYLWEQMRANVSWQYVPSDCIFLGSETHGLLTLDATSIQILVSFLIFFTIAIVPHWKSSVPDVLHCFT